jgi:5-methyltetrahydropteroyltriglutamate--homocysteine methyltransferase
MQRSVERMLCTHVGSLPRRQAIQEFIQQVGADRSRRSAFRDALKGAVRDVLAEQIRAGVDIVSDGAQSKSSFSAYVADRLTGFEGPPGMMPRAKEATEFPDW